MGLLEVLTIVFIILKLIGVISWNWFFVLLPTIISVVLYFVVWAVFGAISFRMFKK